MAVCLNGGPKVLIKMMPISKLRSDFLFEQINLTNQKFDSVSANVKAIICDGNCVNQAFFLNVHIHSGKTMVNSRWKVFTL